MRLQRGRQAASGSECRSTRGCRPELRTRLARAGYATFTMHRAVRLRVHDCLAILHLAALLLPRAAAARGRVHNGRAAAKSGRSQDRPFPLTRLVSIACKSRSRLRHPGAKAGRTCGEQAEDYSLAKLASCCVPSQPRPSPFFRLDLRCALHSKSGPRSWTGLKASGAAKM